MVDIHSRKIRQLINTFAFGFAIVIVEIVHVINLAQFLAYQTDLVEHTFCLTHSRIGKMFVVTILVVYPDYSLSLAWV